MMELINHIGITSTSENVSTSIISRLRGCLILSILFAASFLYKFISTICLGLRYLLPESINNIKRLSASMFWELCIYFLKMNGVNFVISGDDINTDSAIIISNHKSLADFIAMAYLARHTNNMLKDKENEKSFKNLTLPRINFFTWFKLWRIPSIRVLINLAKCDENWELENTLSKIVFGKILKSKVPEWIVLFPEVNIWTDEDSSLQKLQSEKFYLPTLQNILYPRFSAFYNVVSTLNSKEYSKFNQLYDVTVLYESRTTRTRTLTNKPTANENIAASPLQKPLNIEMNLVSPSLLEIFSSETPITVHIHVKSKRLLRIPTKRSKIEKWLENTWVEKDKFLEQWKAEISKPALSVYNCKTSQTRVSLIKTGSIKLESLKNTI